MRKVKVFSALTVCLALVWSTSFADNIAKTNILNSTSQKWIISNYIENGGTFLNKPNSVASKGSTSILLNVNHTGQIASFSLIPANSKITTCYPWTFGCCTVEYSWNSSTGTISGQEFQGASCSWNWTGPDTNPTVTIQLNN